MTAPDVRTTAEAFRFSAEQWREYQSIPDQGYSHRHWIERQVNEWAALVTPTREQIAEVLAASYEPECAGVLDVDRSAADAVLTFMQEIGGGEPETRKALSERA